MSYSVRLSLIIALVISLSEPARAYINAGFKSEAEARRYYQAQRDARERDRLAVIEQAISRDPTDAVAYHQRGRYYGDFRHCDWKKALDDFNTAIRLKPDFAVAWFRRSIVHINMKDDVHCAADLEQAIKLDPNESYRFRMALLYFTSSNPDVQDLRKARKLAEELVAAKPRETELMLLAAICAEQADFEAAVQWETLRWNLSSDRAGRRRSLEAYHSAKTISGIRDVLRRQLEVFPMDAG